MSLCDAVENNDKATVAKLLKKKKFDIDAPVKVCGVGVVVEGKPDPSSRLSPFVQMHTPLSVEERGAYVVVGAAHALAHLAHAARRRAEPTGPRGVLVRPNAPAASGKPRAPAAAVALGRRVGAAAVGVFVVFQQLLVGLDRFHLITQTASDASVFIQQVSYSRRHLAFPIHLTRVLRVCA